MDSMQEDHARSGYPTIEDMLDGEYAAALAWAAAALLDDGEDSTFGCSSLRFL